MKLVRLRLERTLLYQISKDEKVKTMMIIYFTDKFANLPKDKT